MSTCLDIELWESWNLTTVVVRKKRKDFEELYVDLRTQVCCSNNEKHRSVLVNNESSTCTLSVAFM